MNIPNLGCQALNTRPHGYQIYKLWIYLGYQTSPAYIYQVLDTRPWVTSLVYQAPWIPYTQTLAIPWIPDFTGIHIPSLGYSVDTRFTSLDARLHWHTQTLAIPWMPDFTSFWIYRHWITFELKSFNFQQITET